MSVRKFLDLSTGHLTEQTREWIDANLIRVPYGAAVFATYGTFALANGEYGWFVYVPTEPAALQVPDDLATCIRFAEDQDCDWLLFDTDGGRVDGLAFYEDGA